MSDEKVVYRVQIDEYLSKKQILEMFNGWKQTGYGWNIKQNKRINIFQREFQSELAWFDWVKTAPISVVEYRYRAGIEKQVQLTNRKV